MAAVLFDLYETLITEYQEEWTDPGTWTRLGLTEEEGNRQWRRYHDFRMRGEISDFPTVLRNICSDMGVAVNEEVIAQLYQERLDAKERPFLYPEPSIVELILALLSDGVRVTVVSNAAIEEVVAWDKSIFGQLIKDPIFSYQVGCMKPEPQIYEIGCQRVGSFPQATLFVGDGGSRELWGAKAAGLIPVWATWFLDRWPAWRKGRVDSIANECSRCKDPEDLLNMVRTFRP